MPPDKAAPRMRGGGRGGRYAVVEHAKNPVATLRRLLGLLKGRRRFLLLLTIPLAIGSLTGLVWPRVLGLATDLMTLKTPEASVDFRRLAILVASMGGVGRLRPAPGTWGSALVLPLAWLGPGPCMLAAVLFTLAGVLAVSRLPRAQSDPPWVVVDEAAGGNRVAALSRS